MPSKSKAQYRLMEAVKRNPKFAKRPEFPNRSERSMLRPTRERVIMPFRSA